MATIGTFKKTANGEYTGEIVTLSVQAKTVRIVPEATFDCPIWKPRAMGRLAALLSSGALRIEAADNVRRSR